MKNIYLDNAATTSVDKRVLKIILPYFSKKFGNTTSFHTLGQEAKHALEDSRKIVANLMNAKPEEVIFTSSATESNNLALRGVLSANIGKHIIVSSIEHSCILETVKWLEKHGVKVTKLSVDKYGSVDPKDVERAIVKDTVLVSIMHGSNEIGTIEPIVEIGKICKKAGVYFHTDAVQTFGKIEIDVNKMNIDLLTASSHKMYGPKGAACLFIRNGVKIDPIIFGGGQERELRASTVNLPAIVGFAEACKIAKREMKVDAEKQIKLRDKLIKGVLKISNSYLTGSFKNRLPNNASFRFDGVEGESIILHLDLLGISASSGSSCSSSKLEPSHVLLATGLKYEQAHGSLRLTLGKQTTQKDIDYVLYVLPKIIGKLRKISKGI